MFPCILWAQSATTLQTAAASKGLFYGAATHQSALQNDSVFSNAFINQVGVLEPEWEFEMNSDHPTATTYDFSGSDYMLQYAKAHGMLLKGHSLIYGEDVASWVTSTMTSANAKQIMDDYITTVVSRYAGEIHSWVVVNEVINPYNNVA